jgi:hypothetical protein
MSITIAILVIKTLIAKANHACKKAAIASINIGAELKVPYDVDNHWGFLQDICTVLATKKRELRDSDSSLRELSVLAMMALHGLVLQGVQKAMNDSLRPLMNSTSHLAMQIPNGYKYWEQYSEGLITENEYLNLLIVELTYLEGNPMSKYVSVGNVAVAFEDLGSLSEESKMSIVHAMFGAHCASDDANGQIVVATNLMYAGTNDDDGTHGNVVPFVASSNDAEPHELEEEPESDEEPITIRNPVPVRYPESLAS